jgi:hypothetical protein
MSHSETGARIECLAGVSNHKGAPNARASIDGVYRSTAEGRGNQFKGGANHACDGIHPHFQGSFLGEGLY